MRRVSVLLGANQVTTHATKLPGCTPEPLMSYLKALGVFRLVAEQADPAAALSWRGGVACLHSTLDRDALIGFFVERYQPTPIMTPWNSASGFAPTKSGNKAPKDKAARVAAESLATSSSSRLFLYREAIQQLRQIPRGDEGAKNWKQDYFMRCRATLPDSVVRWLDTCFALTNTAVSPFALLGSGGNDGVTDFGSLYMQRLCQVVTEPPTERSKGSLLSSIFAEGHEPLLLDTVGQFNPGGIGGANNTQGSFDADSRINPWDFVLMIEGALLFAGSVTRRMGTAGSGDYAAFPFCVEGVVVGNGSFSEKEARERGKEAPNGGELWLPLWSSQIGYAELSHLFAEGRAQFGSRQARNALEFGLAINLLGVSRGIYSFYRIGFLRRNGKAFLATPLGRVLVKERPVARLLMDQPLVEWLDRFRDACRESDGKREKVPARYKTALRTIDRAMFGFANRSEHANDAKYLVDVLVALGDAERMLARVWRDAKERRITPLQRLSPQWIDQANDSSPEYRLAAALAGIRGDHKNTIGPVRNHIEAIQGFKFLRWPKDSTLNGAWSNRSLTGNLATVFRRRHMDAFREGLSESPLYSPRPAHLSDVLMFLREETDDEKLASLFWGFCALDWDCVKPQLATTTDCGGLEVPFGFGVIRLLVNRLQIKRAATSNGESVWHVEPADEKAEAVSKPDPEVFNLLATGHSNAIQTALDRAACRLKSGGWPIIGHRNRRQAGKPVGGLLPSVAPERLLAAMLFPLAHRDLERIANLVLYPPESEE
jgi:CRISPR-associated protein Csx17